jgi:bacterioferritin
MAKKNKTHPAIDCLNRIFQAEMAGTMRYLHYSFMIMGHNRIPIQKWFRDQAQETMTHAVAVGEWITSFEGHPTMESVPVKETHKHHVDDLLKESLGYEEQTLALYHELAGIAVEIDDVALEEFARGLVLDETNHINEVKKMLRRM